MLHLAGVVQSVLLAVVVEWVMEWCCVLLPNPCPALVSAVPAPHAPQQLTVLYHNYNTQPHFSISFMPHPPPTYSESVSESISLPPNEYKCDTSSTGPTMTLRTCIQACTSGTIGLRLVVPCATHFLAREGIKELTARHVCNTSSLLQSRM